MITMGGGRIPIRGGVAIVCGSARHKRCKGAADCTAEANILCDGPRAAGKTCDKPLCRAHAKSIGPDKDLCPACVAASTPAVVPVVETAPEPAQQLALTTSTVLTATRPVSTRANWNDCEKCGRLRYGTGRHAPHYIDRGDVKLLVDCVGDEIIRNEVAP